MAINIKPENRGKFTASAKKAGMGVQAFAAKVLANKDKYSSTQVKRANFARNASKWNKMFGGLIEKLQNGGPTDYKKSLETILNDENAMRGYTVLSNLTTQAGTNLDDILMKTYSEKGEKGLRTRLMSEGHANYRETSGDNSIKAQIKSLGFGIKRSMAGGGQIDGFKQYNTGSHESGMDTPVDESGMVNTQNPSATVQNKENSYRGYVYSDVLTNPETGRKFNVDMAKIVKKNKRADLDEPTKNKVDFEAARLAKLNDASRAMMEQVQMKYGGNLKKLPFGGWPGAFAQTMIARMLEGSRGVKPVGLLPPPDIKDFTLPTRALPSPPDHLMNNASFDPVSGSTPGAPITNTLLPAMIGKGIELAGKTALAFASDNTGEKPVVNPYETDIVRNMASRSIDLAPVRNRVMANMRAAINNNRNTNRGQGLVNALNANTFATASKQIADTDLQGQQINNQYKADLAQTMDIQGQQRVNASNIANQIVSQNRAARADALQGIAESVGNTGEFVTKIKNSNLSNAETLSLLRNLYPNYTINAANMSEFISALESNSDLIKFRSNA